MNQTACGFTYDIATRRKSDGGLVDLLRDQKNRVPNEGLNDIATAYLKNGAGPAALYIGLWAGSLIPVGTETAANLLGQVTEVTNYVQAERLTLTLGSVTNGGCSNTASLARFDMLGSAVTNGMFLSTVATKGASTGKLLSVVRFANPRTVDESVYLEVLSGFQFVSL